MRSGVTNVVFIGRTGDGKSSTANRVMARLGVAGLPFSEGSSATSHTHEPCSHESQGVRVTDYPGLSDTKGVVQDEKNIQGIVVHARSLGHINAAFLICNEYAPRFDSAMQDAVKLMADSFGVALLKHMGIVFTRSHGQLSKVEARAKVQEIVALIAERVGVAPFDVPFYQIDCHPEDLLKLGVPQDRVDAVRASSELAIDEMIRWAKTLPRMETKDATFGEYELVRKAREAKEAAERAEAKRLYDASVVKTETEKTTREVSCTVEPIYQAQQRSREEWKGGMVPKWGEMGKKTVYWTENVHVGNRTTKVMREEERLKQTLGSGTVVIGDWRVVREWVETA